MKRAWIKRGTKRMNQVSKKRRVSGEFDGKLKAQLLIRSGGRCEIRAPGCMGLGTDRAHIIPRGSASGQWILGHTVWACRRCHDLDREEYSRGRLVWNVTRVPIEVLWTIEVRPFKGGPLLDCLGMGKIRLSLPVPT